MGRNGVWHHYLSSHIYGWMELLIRNLGIIDFRFVDSAVLHGWFVNSAVLHAGIVIRHLKFGIG
jgi:hypothetical protein